MLIRFTVENFRSIAHEAELSMVAVDRDREGAVPVEPLGESLLKVAAVYGPNASGKSNLVAGFGWLRDAVQQSLKRWDGEVPCDPFAFGSGPERPSRFTLELAVDGVRFEYVLEVDHTRVLRESLHHYPKKLRRRVFERDRNGVVFQRGMGALAGTRELLTDTSLVMSIAPRFREPLVLGFANELRRLDLLGPVPSRRRNAGRDSTLRLLEAPDQPSLFSAEDGGLGEVASARKKVLSLLRLADLGIDDVRVDKEAVPISPGSSRTWTIQNVRLIHNVAGTRAPLDWDNESNGTHAWFGLIGPVLSALEHGSLLVLDELDASLHPTLSTELIRIFRRRDTNPRGAQLIFTSHDTSLLNHLNRDEVWLTERAEDGATTLGSLAEFAGERVRKSQNLESGYLHGKFGALPNVDQFAFLRSLGLAG
jgi:energy-coupling factor transporter ATP-binding protein EcfA2